MKVAKTNVKQKLKAKEKEAKEGILKQEKEEEKEAREGCEGMGMIALMQFAIVAPRT